MQVYDQDKNYRNFQGVQNSNSKFTSPKLFDYIWTMFVCLLQALDARCLIDVFEVLKKWMTEGNIVVDLNECSPRLPWLFPKRSRWSILLLLTSVDMRGVGSTLASSIYISGVRTSMIGPIGKVKPRWRPLTSNSHEGCKQFKYHLPQLISSVFRIANQVFSSKNRDIILQIEVKIRSPVGTLDQHHWTSRKHIFHLQKKTREACQTAKAWNFYRWVG
jgi:hypothetical protein